MARTSDPLERALMAFHELDDAGKKAFHAVLKHISRIDGNPTPAPAPRRGRPVGSKNKPPELQP